jgi:predicted metal-dependent hydrolase
MLKVYTFDEDPFYSTKEHKLVLKGSNRKIVSIRLSKGKINIAYPIELSSDSKDVKEAIIVGINRALEKEAKEYLPNRVAKLARKYRFEYNSIDVENEIDRWGINYGDNNIKLSIQLMRLPDHLIDYVILHELVHSVEKNHNKEGFWKLLCSVCSDARKYQRQLRKYRKYREEYGTVDLFSDEYEWS